MILINYFQRNTALSIMKENPNQFENNYKYLKHRQTLGIEDV